MAESVKYIFARLVTICAIRPSIFELEYDIVSIYNAIQCTCLFDDTCMLTYTCIV